MSPDEHPFMKILQASSMGQLSQAPSPPEIQPLPLQFPTMIHSLFTSLSATPHFLQVQLWWQGQVPASSAPQNEHMTKQHKPDVDSEGSQPLNA